MKAIVMQRRCPEREERGAMLQGRMQVFADIALGEPRASSFFESIHSLENPARYGEA
jgi:hypothetical protein